MFGLQLDHVEREHGLHHVLEVELNRDLGFAMERENLLRDLCYTLQLSGGLLKKSLNLALIIRMRGKINQVGQRFQRIMISWAIVCASLPVAASFSV